MEPCAILCCCSAVGALQGQCTFCRCHETSACLQERARLLSFVIVGGGPTGVEVAAEMFDMMQEDMSKLYPELMPFVKIRVIELMDYVLSAYDRKLGEYTANLFKRNGIELVCPARIETVNGCVQSSSAVVPVTCPTWVYAMYEGYIDSHVLCTVALLQSSSLQSSSLKLNQ